MRDKLAPQPDDSTPIYLQLARKLREQIASGGIDPGNALPSERNLSDLTGMSRVTIRKAIDKLIEEGLLFRKHGSGTFVAPRIEAPAFLSGFSDDARRRGDKPGVIWMMKAYASPTEDEAAMLEIPVVTKVARLSRIRLSDGEPLAIEHAVVPARFLPALEELGDSLYEALGAHGYRPVKGQQRIRASLATPTEAGIFSVRENAEVLRIERVTRLGDGTPVEFTRSAYRGDRYEFVSDLRCE
ncbi:GntR family transcriptional regulator [Nitrospirillum amazonense]|uniref:GntR family transcriptional regulator n=1 Tax=Nitrospirillum amazonense TaxID=28077 RepID=A0A560JLK3_9PROT|nr:GntR family transcriptional regulator [Nitrospirillum amazonense]MDG3439008.1 GntR family transcriptional regulator [Nitrospirillum amazonense]TWB69190.1 GntR family transcriptional regulator [Nitrospirillum amazonense]